MQMFYNSEFPFNQFVFLLSVDNYCILLAFIINIVSVIQFWPFFSNKLLPQGSAVAGFLV